MKDGGIVTEISLEAIFDAENLQRAFESFEGKRDSCGADGVMVSDLPEYWNANQVVIKDTIYSGNYSPEREVTNLTESLITPEPTATIRLVSKSCSCTILPRVFSSGIKMSSPVSNNSSLH